MSTKNRRRHRRSGCKAVRAFNRNHELLVELICLAKLLALICPDSWAAWVGA